MNVKIIGSWKNDEQREILLIIWKIIKLTLEARKSKKKACEKKWQKIKKKKEKEKASRKSQ